MNSSISSSHGDQSEDDHSAADIPVTSAAKRRDTRGAVTVLLAEEPQIAHFGLNAALAPEDDIAVVGQTRDCAHVFKLAERLRPQVVVITVRMALRMGLESMRIVLRDKCGARLLVLVPQCDSAFVRHEVAAGAVGYLASPDSSPRLAKAIRDVCLNTPPAPSVAMPNHDSPRASAHVRETPVKVTTELTSREREALQLIAQGHPNKQIADKMCISIKTVEKHRQHLMDKLAIHETATLTRYAIYAGIDQ